MFRFLLFLSLFFASASSCLAFEPSFYDDRQDPAKFQEIWETQRRADRYLQCRDLDKISVGIGIETKGSGSDIYFSPTYFKRTELAPFLKSEKHKDLLVAIFEKPMLWPSEELERELSEFQEFVGQFGYKRVLVLGAHSSGVLVLYDSSEPAGKQTIPMN